MMRKYPTTFAAMNAATEIATAAGVKPLAVGSTSFGKGWFRGVIYLAPDARRVQIDGFEVSYDAPPETARPPVPIPPPVHPLLFPRRPDMPPGFFPDLMERFSDDRQGFIDAAVAAGVGYSTAKARWYKMKSKGTKQAPVVCRIATMGRPAIERSPYTGPKPWERG